MKLSDEKGRTRYGLVKYVLQNFCVNHKKGIMEAFLATIALFVWITNGYFHTSSLIISFKSVYSSHEFILISCIILLYIFLISNLCQVFDKNSLLIRYTSLRRWYDQKILTGLYVIPAYMFFVNFPFLVSLVIHNDIGSITFEFIGFWLLSILFQGMGFIIIGLLYCFIHSLTGRNVISGILTYLILTIPSLIRGLFYVKVNSYPDYMFLGNLNKNSSVESVLLQFIVFVIIGILLHFLNLTIIEKKDIMWRE